MNNTALLVLAFSLKICMVLSHGRLVEPPSRASAWRYGYKTPADYNDNQGYCGGAYYQHEFAGGKCGICGDPWGGKRRHEAPGGKFATGTITGTYKSGEVLPVTIQITANHFGYFVFKLCPNNNPAMDPTQQCFDNLVLKTTSGETEYYMPDQKTRPYSIDLQLPPGLTCSQCILQWTYITANSWGQNEDGFSCVGCGPQETFRACADIRVVGPGSLLHQNVSNEANTEIGEGGVAASMVTAETPVVTSSSQGSAVAGDSLQCKAVGLWSVVPDMNRWCNLNCNHKPVPYCPQTHCTCRLVNS